jgi:outer membrane protein OmpA-like peptidoglycan-associated protein
MSPLSTTLRTSLCAIGATALLTACGGKAHVEDTPTMGSDDSYSYYEVGLDNALREACQEFDLPPPTFRFDSAQVDDKTRTALTGLAACLNGPMSTMTVRLVGHADVRGPDDYNHELGLERAESVKNVLTQNGVAADRITIGSHGEAEASGTGSHERRVDVTSQGEMPAASAGTMRRVTIYGVRPVDSGTTTTFEETRDTDGDGVDEPETVTRPNQPAAEGGGAMEETGDPDGDGVDEPATP